MVHKVKTLKQFTIEPQVNGEVHFSKTYIKQANAFWDQVKTEDVERGKQSRSRL